MRKLLPILAFSLVIVLIAFAAREIFTIKKRVLPNSVEITIPKESAILKIAQTGFGLTSNYNIVDSPDSGLPVLYLPQDLELSAHSQGDVRIVFVVRLVELLTKTDFYPATVRIIREQEIVVYNQKQQIAVFTSEKDASSQVDSLQQTLAAAKIDGDKIAKIDLRFGKPVVTFK